jgi:hypothetical protein
VLAEIDGAEDEVVLYPGLGDNPPEEHIVGYEEFKDIVWGTIDDPDSKDSIISNSIPWGGTGEQGSIKDVGGLDSVLSVFFHLWPLSVWSDIVIETNAYAHDCAKMNWYLHPRIWTPLTVGELLRWHGICLALSVGQFNGPIKLCWTGRKVGAVQWPDFREFMTLFRFEQIKQYLHLRSNVGRPPMNTREGRLWQVEWLEHHLNHYAKKLWNPTQRMTADEKGFPSRHKYCPIRVCNPTKPHKFHILQQAIGDAHGYIWHSWIYDRIKRTGLKAYVIDKLLATLPNAGFKVYFDRWYGSTLCCQLSNHHHQNATMTRYMTMPATYLPPALKAYTKNNMTQGDCHYQYCEDPPICVAVWKDRNRVIYASTHERPYGGVVHRLQPDHTRADVSSPEMGVEYNQARPIVDAVDAKALGTGSLEMAITSHKWWHAAYFGLFDLTTTRLEVLTNKLGLTNSRLDLTLKLQDELLTNKIDIPVAGGTRGNVTDAADQHLARSRFSGTHQPTDHLVFKGVGAARTQVKKQAHCVVCRAENFGKTTLRPRHTGGPPIEQKVEGSKVVYWCELCSVHLCLGSCFNRYHKEYINHLDYGPKRAPKRSMN